MTAPPGLGEPDRPGPVAAQEAARVRAVTRYLDLLDRGAKARTDLDALCEIAAVVCGVPSASVDLIDADTQFPVGIHGDEPVVSPRAESLCAVTMAIGTDVVVPDARADPRFADNAWVDGRLGGVRFYAASLMRNPNGHVLGALCVYAEQPHALPDAQIAVLATLARQAGDVLELELQTQRLEVTLAELERSHAELAAFAGRLSHDLKTPLTSAIGFAELLGERPGVRADPVAADYARRTEAAGRRMLSMIDEMLAYARVGGILHPVPVALDEVMPAVLADLGPSAAAVTVEWPGPDDEGAGTVWADPAQLRALLQNLVGNAVAYRRLDVASRVSLTVQPGPTGLVLRVADNGTSIPPGERERALAPLRRLRRDVPGSGLGLSICVRIAEAHGGTLTLEETPGGGTTVRVSLPGPPAR